MGDSVYVCMDSMHASINQNGATHDTPNFPQILRTVQYASANLATASQLGWGRHQAVIRQGPHDDSKQSANQNASKMVC